jgi:GxxExxY protein
MDDDAREFVDEESEPNPELNRITNAIIGAAIDVHRALGPGFYESVYEEALAIAFKKRGIHFSRQLEFGIIYEGQVVGSGRVDFLVENVVIVEIKAIEAFGLVHTAQIISYLRAMKKPLGILLNFNVKQLINGIKRIAL